MSEIKHTPGIWTIVPQTNGSSMIVHEFETGKQMQPKSMRLIANVFARGDTLKTDEANARLIAAAPEMLEALKRAEIHFRVLPQSMDEPGSVMDEIKKAIAKAEGRQ